MTEAQVPAVPSGSQPARASGAAAGRRAGGARTRVRPAPGQDDHLVAVGEGLADERLSEKPGSSGDDDLHAAVTPLVMVTAAAVRLVVSNGGRA